MLRITLPGPFIVGATLVVAQEWPGGGLRSPWEWPWLVFLIFSNADRNHAYIVCASPIESSLNEHRTYL